MATYLITGGLGFIGRHLADELLAAGHMVRVLDSLVEQVHGGTRPPMPASVEVVTGDCRDATLVGPALDGVSGVFHLAAEVGVGQSMYEIERYVGGNDLATAALLQAMIDRPVRRIVVASSMSVYGEGLYRTAGGRRADHARRQAARAKAGLWDLVDDSGTPLVPVPTDESKPVDLASIYALTKFFQERAVLIFGEAYGVEAVALRLFNVFGAGQALSNPYTGVLANFASRIINGEPPLVFEDGEQRRDFVHVRDVARAFRLAMERPHVAGEVINVGSGRSYTVSEVARLVAAALGRPDLKPEIMQKARSGDIRNNFADISKARRLLGFEPAEPLETALDEFAVWVSRTGGRDRSAEMKRQLEARGLVS